MSLYVAALAEAFVYFIFLPPPPPPNGVFLWVENSDVREDHDGTRRRDGNEPF